MQTQYEDIITLPHPTSATHPRMSRHNRAAQFAPFAALTGYDSAIQEAGRTTDCEVELDEDRVSALDGQLRDLEAHLSLQPIVAISYFQPDNKKSGGAYLHFTGVIRSIDRNPRQLVTDSGIKIPLEHITDFEYSVGYSRLLGENSTPR